MKTITKHCPLCGVKEKKAHLATCTKSKKYKSPKETQNVLAFKLNTPSKQHITKQLGHPSSGFLPKTVVNHIGILVDMSGSMGHLVDIVPSLIGDYVNNIKTMSANEGQTSYLSLATFNSEPNIRYEFSNQYHNQPFLPMAYVPRNETKLVDSVMEMAMKLEMNFRNVLTEDEAFLLSVYTDGKENRSTKYNSRDLTALITRLQNTGKWTFVFNCPPGATNTVHTYGVPIENIREWEATTEGLRESVQSNAIGFASYTNTRSAGGMSTQSYFKTDVSTIPKKAIDSQPDIRLNFACHTVAKEQRIDEFLRKTKHGFAVGRGYYSLTKKETVQNYKDIVMRHNGTGKIVSARALLGVPSTDKVVMEPKNHGEYTIFVQSNSSNRKLVRGTELLYRLV